MLQAYRTRTEPGMIIIDLLVVAILCSILRKLLPLHTFLEFGASDRDLINLMENRLDEARVNKDAARCGTSISVREE